MSEKINEQCVYLQIYSKLKDDIVRQVYKFGVKLPSKRVAAAEFGVSAITVEHAYALLGDEGYIEPRERRGYFVIFRPHDGFAVSSDEPFLRQSDGRTVVKNCGSTADITADEPTAQDEGFPFSVLTKTMRKVMNDCGKDLLERSPNKGVTALREAIKNYLARNRGIYVTVEQIVVGAGAEYLYSLIAALMGRDKVFALEKPSYEQIENVYRAEGVKCELLPLGKDGIESGALARSAADVLHISPYRSYPTGITASASKRYEYLRWATAGKFIVEDDFESEFSVSSKPEETLFALSERGNGNMGERAGGRWDERLNGNERADEHAGGSNFSSGRGGDGSDDRAGDGWNDRVNGRGNVIYLNTFTRTISPSLRAGYMVMPESLTEKFDESLGFYSCTVPTFEQYVLAQLLDGGDFERHINRVRRAKRKRIGG